MPLIRTEHFETVLKENPRFIVSASSQAEKAVKYILMN